MPRSGCSSLYSVNLNLKKSLKIKFLLLDFFKRTTNNTLEKYAPKKWYVTANQGPFMNKNINKEIMKRSRIRNKFLNTKNNIDMKTYNCQHSISVTLTRQEKKNFYSKLNTWDITDNATFLKKVKPFLKDKIQNKAKTSLIEND